VPFAGEYHGEHGTAAFLARLDGISPPLTPTLGDLMVDGNSAMVRWTMPIRSGSTQAELQFIDLIRLRQGRIVALDQVFDTGAAARLLGAQPLPRPPRRAARRGNATSTRRPAPES
jgi:ketosteroid isomerase-like protein